MLSKYKKKKILTELSYVFRTYKSYEPCTFMTPQNPFHFHTEKEQHAFHGFGMKLKHIN